MSWKAGKPVEILPKISALVAPQVNPQACEIHLQHLQVFNQLRGTDALSDQIFLCRSERRYQDWLEFIHSQPSIGSTWIPPPDIQQMWHVHLLNPFNYITDTTSTFHTIIPHSLPSIIPTSLFQRQQSLCQNINGDMKIDAMVVESADSSQDPLLEQSQSLWQSKTEQSYLISPHDIKTKIPWKCPECNKDTMIEPEKYTEWRMSGTLVRAKDAKPAPTMMCHYCVSKNEWTLENYGVKRLILALFTQKSHLPASTSSLTQEAATAVLHVNGAVIDGRTQKMDVATTIHELATWLDDPNWASATAGFVNAKGCTWEAWKTLVGTQSKRLFAAKKLRSIRPATIRRIASSYRNTIGPFSMDLIAAVIRQREFIAKMCNPSSYHSSTIVGTGPDALHQQMTHAIQRYHKFLYLMYYAPGRMLVPTLDIDLAWHTHQLDPLAYKQTCETIVLKMINHNDAIGARPLDNGFLDTSTLWYQVFKEPYSIESPTKRYMTSGKIACGVLFFPYGIYLALKGCVMKSMGTAGDPKHSKQSGCSIPSPQMRQTAVPSIRSTESTKTNTSYQEDTYLYVVASCGVRTCGTHMSSCAIQASCGVVTHEPGHTHVPTCGGSSCGTNHHGGHHGGDGGGASTCGSSCGGGHHSGHHGGSSCGSSCGSSGGTSSCGGGGSSCGGGGSSCGSSTATSSCSSGGGSSCASSGGSSCSSSGGSSCSSGGSSCSSGGSSCSSGGSSCGGG